ncbi:hypothetical protein NXX04_11930 [Bacteroides ovatus]|nr:hypothetical protein [Bacteroides ovatus]
MWREDNIIEEIVEDSNIEDAIKTVLRKRRRKRSFAGRRILADVPEGSREDQAADQEWAVQARRISGNDRRRRAEGKDRTIGFPWRTGSFLTLL